MKSEIKVPDGWKDMPLGEILNVGTGKKNVQDSIENGKYPFFTRSVKTQRINSWSYDCEGLFIAGEGNFSVRYYKGKFELHQRCYLLSALNEKSISMKFLQNAIQIKINNLIRTAVKSTVISLRKPLIENLKILLPPFEEQQKIADILSKVDEQIDFTEKIIDKTEKLKKGLMQKLLTKGIGHAKFKKTELGEIPEEWRIRKLNKSTEINPNYNLTKNKEYDYIPMDSVSENFNGLKYLNRRVYNNSSGSKIKKGDIIFAKITPCIENGKIAIINELNTEYAIGSTEFFVFSPFNFLDSAFLFYQLCSKKLHQKAINLMEGTTGRQRVNKNVFGHSKILIPSLNEQKQIASILSKVDEQITDNKKELSHLQELKKGLMQDLLTGKVRVTV